MAKNVELMGAVFPDCPAVMLPTHEGPLARFTDVSDSQAVAADVAQGKAFYLADGTKATGTNQGGGGGGGGGTLVPYVLRPDAELVQRWTKDERVVADLGVTLPTYSTSNTQVVAQETLKADSYSIEYDYYVTERFLTIPEYSTATLGKGRPDYQYASLMYEIVRIPPYTIKPINGSYGNTQNISVAITKKNNQLYWTSASANSVHTTNFGVCQIEQDVVATNDHNTQISMTIKSPSVTLRGSTTYFVNTYYNALTDIRRQYIIELWRAPKGNMNVDGWGSMQQTVHIHECVNSDSHNLT